MLQNKILLGVVSLVLLLATTLYVFTPGKAEAHTNLNINLRGQDPAMSGTMVDDSGQALRHAQISLTRQTNAILPDSVQSLGTTTTDGQGQFNLPLHNVTNPANGSASNFILLIRPAGSLNTFERTIQINGNFFTATITIHLAFSSFLPFPIVVY